MNPTLISKDISDLFPSPTGVNHYESAYLYIVRESTSNRFRPQQGLIIMNKNFALAVAKEKKWCFRPQQGLIIMN